LIYLNNENVCNLISENKKYFVYFLVNKVDLQDKEFLTALANHAQALARIILKRSDSGYHLAEDAQVYNNSYILIFSFLFQLAIIENIRNLKYLLDQRLENVSDDVYREILRDTLQHVCKEKK
jgi:hypothetical protein